MTEKLYKSKVSYYETDCMNIVHHSNYIRYFEDARIINPNDLPDIDLICAGFPCQRFSVAGKRLGFADDTRGTLFFEAARIAAMSFPLK